MMASQSCRSLMTAWISPIHQHHKVDLLNWQWKPEKSPIRIWVAFMFKWCLRDQSCAIKYPPHYYTNITSSLKHLYNHVESCFHVAYVQVWYYCLNKFWSEFLPQNFWHESYPMWSSAAEAKSHRIFTRDKTLLLYCEPCRRWNKTKLQVRCYKLPAGVKT